MGCLATIEPGHPYEEVAVLLVSEIFGNSVRHSGLGAAGETVAVIAGDGIVVVEVTDRAGPRCRRAAARRAERDLVRTVARLNLLATTKSIGPSARLLEQAGRP